MRKTLLVLVLLLGLLTGCNSDLGSGKMIEINQSELTDLSAKKEPYFLYATSILETDSESESIIKLDMQSAIKDEKVDVYYLDLHKANINFDELEALNLESSTSNLAFYHDGVFKEEIDLLDIDENELSSQVQEFIQKIKSRYLDN
ncbi:hypothetical protein [Metabacillus fastidiosus]|uniref:hypothetical protein n=1 Tax=Metabacillus fastidiosus TaxID=1458 RepID=UPI003D2E488D